MLLIVTTQFYSKYRDFHAGLLRTPQLGRLSFSLGNVFSGSMLSSCIFFRAHSARKFAARFGRAAGYIGIGETIVEDIFELCDVADDV